MIGDIYYLEVQKNMYNNAGSKAPSDIAKICSDAGYEELYFPWISNRLIENISFFSFLRKLFFAGIYFVKWCGILFEIPPHSLVIYQHPNRNTLIINKIISIFKKKKNCKFVALVHDLETLRKGFDGGPTYKTYTHGVGDDSLLRSFDAIICHNEHMRQYLIEQGFQADKLVNLDIFDYLDNNERVQPNKSKKPTIAIAANLAPGKCSYIYDVIDEEASRNTSLVMNLYGNNFDPSKAKPNMVYKGSFKPDELSKYLEGDFGLVWDGTSAETCKGNTGEYLRYNNPHKVSFYLSAGMPVVVWREAAIADFILENGVGIAVDSLYDLEEQIAKVSPEEYAKMCENVKKIQKRLHNGYYFKTAFEKALEIIQ